MKRCQWSGIARRVRQHRPLPSASAIRITPASPILLPLRQRLRSPALGELAPAASDEASAWAPLRPIRFHDRSSVRIDAHTPSTAASASTPISPSMLSCNMTALTRSRCRTRAATSTRPPEGPIFLPPRMQSPSTWAAACQVTQRPDQIPQISINSWRFAPPTSTARDICSAVIPLRLEIPDGDDSTSSMAVSRNRLQNDAKHHAQPHRFSSSNQRIGKVVIEPPPMTHCVVRRESVTNSVKRSCVSAPPTTRPCACSACRNAASASLMMKSISRTGSAD